MVSSDRLLRLLAETFREIGVLVTVFAPLDALFAERIISPDLVISITAASTMLMICGILLEARA